MMKQPAPYLHFADALADHFLTRDLKRLADFAGITVPTRKDERVKALTDYVFSDPQGLLNQLSSLEQLAVRETIFSSSGVYDHQMFINKYECADHFAPSSENSPPSMLIFLFIIDRRVPRDLTEELKKFLSKPADVTFNYYQADSPQKTIEEQLHNQGLTVRKTEQAALANLQTLLISIQDKKIRISPKTGKGTAATIRAISELLYEGDWYEDGEPMQSFAWPLLLQAGGLAKKDGSSLKLTPAGRKALHKDPAEGIRKAWAKWEKNRLFDEFSRVTALKGQKAGRGRTMTSPVRRRPMLNMLLKDLQPGQWISLDEMNRLTQSSPLYSFEMVNYFWKLYFADAHYGHIDSDDTWQLLQFRYLLMYLFEYCATMGIVEVAYEQPVLARNDYRSWWGTDELEYLSHCDGLRYVRLTALGAYVLELTDSYEAAADRNDLYCFDGLDIVITRGTSLVPGQELFLDKIAERKDVDRWNVTDGSLLQAIENGDILTEIKSELKKNSAEQFSEQLERLFDDVAHRSTAFINAGTATLIKCGTEYRKELLMDSRLNSICMPAGKNHLVIMPGKEKIFARRLAAKGFIVGLPS